MLNLPDGLSPEEIEEKIKAHANAHKLTYLWSTLRETLYNTVDGYLACKYRHGTRTAYHASTHYCKTRAAAKQALDDDPHEGNVLVHVVELEWAKRSYRLGRSDAGTRLRLFEVGNDACPICLRAFSKHEVESGESVTLARVPIRSFSMDVSLDVCLTCEACDTAGVESAVASQLIRPRAQLEFGGTVQTADLEMSNDGAITATIPPRHLPERAFRDAVAKGQPGKMTILHPQDPRAATVTWLKASYLLVFSLLGVHGYRYARGKAIERVRRQIMEPDRRLLPPFTFTCTNDVSGILMNRKGTPCWAVGMEGLAVLLPRGWDESFYDDLHKSWPSGKGDLGGGPVWFPARFGWVRSGSITFKEDVDVAQTVGGAEQLFGAQGRVVKDGEELNFIVADWNGQQVTTLNTQGLRGAEGE